MVNIDDKCRQRLRFQSGKLENIISHHFTAWNTQFRFQRFRFLIVDPLKISEECSYFFLQKPNSMAVSFLSCSCPKPILSERIRATVVCWVANLPSLRCSCFSTNTHWNHQNSAWLIWQAVLTFNLHIIIILKISIITNGKISI